MLIQTMVVYLLVGRVEILGALWVLAVSRLISAYFTRCVTFVRHLISLFACGLYKLQK